MCSITPTKCCPKFALCETMPTEEFVFSFTKPYLSLQMGPKKHKAQSQLIVYGLWGFYRVLVKI